MKIFQKKSKLNSLKNNKFKTYLLYAIGEILLIIAGILIAVNINDSIKHTKDTELRCTYLNELLYTFEYDIEDVEGNIRAFKEWNPKIVAIHNAILEDNLSSVDSLEDKFGTVGNFIFFGQSSKSKIDELKYSSINLIENRELKNKLLQYQDYWVGMIVTVEAKNHMIGEDLRQYYTDNFLGFNYGVARPLDIKKLQKDNRYRSLIYQRLKLNSTMKSNYEALSAEQKEIQELILKEIEKNCKK